MNNSELDDADATTISAWMWVWFFSSALATGVALGNIFQTSSDFSRGTEFGWPAFFGGVVFGLIANIPLLALFLLGKKILANLVGVRINSKQLLAIESDALANGVATRKHTARIPVPMNEG